MVDMARENSEGVPHVAFCSTAALCGEIAKCLNRQFIAVGAAWNKLAA